MSGASSFVHSTTAEAGNGMETRGRAVTNEIARNCFPLAFSFSGPQIKNPYISSIHKDFFHLLQPLYQGFKSGNGTRTRDPQLGKLMLYQLSYFRKCRGKYTVFPFISSLKRAKKIDDSEKTPTFFRTDTAAQYECRRVGEGKARPAPCRSPAADKRGKTFLPAPATKPQTTEQKRKRVSREKPTSPPATHSIFSTAKNASCGTSTFPT